jgi:hypothetical protein
MTPTRRRGIAGFATLVALSAYGGAVGLAGGGADPNGTLDDRLPFHSPVFAALALVAIVAVPNTALAWYAARGDRHTGIAARFAGLMLIGWIAVEIAIIRELSWLQPIYAGVGVALVAVGRHLDHVHARELVST